MGSKYKNNNIGRAFKFNVAFRNRIKVEGIDEHNERTA
jgi:hypothetical protein